MVIFKMLVLISTYIQPTPLVRSIGNVLNQVAALVPTVPNWTINSIQTILIKIISILAKMIYNISTIISISKLATLFPLY